MPNLIDTVLSTQGAPSASTSQEGGGEGKKLGNSEKKHHH
jgi:hypothetical protein